MKLYAIIFQAEDHEAETEIYASETGSTGDAMMYLNTIDGIGENVKVLGVYRMTSVTDRQGNPYKVGISGGDTLIIDTAMVAKVMRHEKALKRNDGWTNCLVDTVEELYGLEAAVQSLVGMDADKFASTYEPGADRRW